MTPNATRSVSTVASEQATPHESDVSQFPSLKLPLEVILMIFSYPPQQRRSLRYNKFQPPKWKPVSNSEIEAHFSSTVPITIPTMRKYKGTTITKSWNAHHHPLDPPLFRTWNQEVYDLAVRALIEGNMLQLNVSEVRDTIDLSRQCHFFLRPFVRHVTFEFRNLDLYEEKADVMDLVDIVKGRGGIT